MEETKDKFPASAKELRSLYNVCQQTWQKWIKKLIDNGTIELHTKIYTPKQVAAIIELLGEP